MFKRAAILGLVLFAAGAVVAPTAALAQDAYVYGGYSNGYNQAYYPRDDRYCDRHERQEWREHERAERRAFMANGTPTLPAAPPPAPADILCTESGVLHRCCRRLGDSGLRGRRDSPPEAPARDLE